MNDRLHEQAPTTRFSDRAADYVKFRPGYPAGAIDAVLEGLGDPSRLVVADVGAGTGISARLLAERGARVIAVEPNAPMRRAGEAHTRDAGLPRAVEWRDGTAESTGLEGASVDLILCAQSYHWFEPAGACREFGRVLSPGGRLALMWNDGDESDPVARGYYDLVRAASMGAGPSSHQTVAKNPRVEAPFDQDEIRWLRLRNVQRLDEAGLIGRAMSASYVPKDGPKAERLVAGLRRLHAEHAGADGCVGLVYEVWVYMVASAPLWQR